MPSGDRTLRIGSIAMLFALVPAVAAAEVAPDKAACLASSNAGQDLRSEGKLRDARKEFATCAASSCPKVLRAECEKWLAEVEQAIPTASFRVRAADGSDAVNCTVTSAGATQPLTGSAMPLDPGKHVLTFSCEGHAPAERTIVIAEGEKLRVIEVSLDGPKPAVASPAPSTAPSDARRSEPRTLAWVTAGVAVVAFGSFAYFGLSGRSRAEDLRTSCKPRCPDDDVADVDRRLLIADISLGVGVLATGLSTWLFLRKTEPSPVAPVAAIGPSVAFVGLNARF